MQLTIVKPFDDWDWYVIERAEHDGASWLEPAGNGALALRCSSRFSDADVEGAPAEMLAIADAIERRDSVSFKRCAVNATGEPVTFWSPRNSSQMGSVSLAEADALAMQIRARLESKRSAGEKDGAP